MPDGIEEASGFFLLFGGGVNKSQWKGKRVNEMEPGDTFICVNMSLRII